jgi:hypothetical protein
MPFDLRNVWTEMAVPQDALYTTSFAKLRTIKIQKTVLSAWKRKISVIFIAQALCFCRLLNINCVWSFDLPHRKSPQDLSPILASRQ